MNQRGRGVPQIPALCAVAAAIALTAASAWAQWSMFHGDPRHSGYASLSSPATAIAAWSYQSSDSMFFSSPVVGLDQSIYIANLDGKLLALRNAGNLRWKFNAATGFRHSTPAVAGDGTIYIGGNNGQLFAVNPDGTLRWTFTAPAAIKTSPNIAPDGTIYFGADDGKLYAVRPDSTLLWTYQTGDTIRSSPAIGPDGTIFFGSQDFYFYALNPNGTLRWRAATGNIIKYCSPAVSSTGIVYFGSYDGYVYALSSSGALQWAHYTAHVIRSSPAIGNDGVVYVADDDDLRAINPNGTLRWKFTTGGEIYSSACYSANDGIVTIGSDDGVLYAIHANTSSSDGTLAWQYPVGQPIRTSPAPTSAGNIIVGDLSGKVWAFGLPSTVSVPGGEAACGPAVWAQPNPASGWVRFRPGSGAAPDARLEIYDIRGRRIVSLDRGKGRAYEWDGLDPLRRPVPPGMYLYRLEGQTATGRLVMLR